MTGDLLAIYDGQLRTDGELDNALDVQRDGPLIWARFGFGGFVTYRDLAGLAGAALDAAIARTVAYFRDETDVESFEWKTRGHDLPADLGQRLLAAGLVAEDVETVMMGEASGLTGAPAPEGIVIRRVDDLADPVPLVSQAGDMQREVFGRGPSIEETLSRIAGESAEFWVAMDGDRVVSAGRLEFVPNTEVAGLWGGATRAEYRGRGIYRALTAARAKSTLARGYRYLHSDCTEMSRPILERSGLVAVTTTTPYIWRRQKS